MNLEKDQGLPLKQRVTGARGKKSAPLIAIAALLLSCGPGSNKDTIPRLPGDGDEHTAKVLDKVPDETGPKNDPWKEAELIRPPEAKKPSAVKLPPIVRFRLPNGLRVIVVEDRDLPLVNMQLAVKAGGGDESRGKTGVAEMVASMLTKGTRRRSALQIAKAIDFVGGRLSGRSSFEASLVSCSVLSKNLGTCLTLLPDVVASPTFPKKEIGVARNKLHAEVRQRRDNAGILASAHFQNLLWGEDHVRGWPMSAASVDAIKRKDLVAFHRAWYRPNNAILAIAGDVDAKKLRWRLQRAFRFWYRGKVPKRKKYTEPDLATMRVRLVDKPGQTQSHIRLGHLGLRHGAKDFYDAVVWNYALGGGGFSSRILKVIRSQAGKTYTAHSGFDRHIERGAFAISTFTRSAETKATVRLILTEMAKMAKNGPTAAEVSDAITNIAGSYSTRFESSAAVASALLGAELHGFKDDYVRNYPLEIGKVTQATARESTQKRLDPQRFALVIVGDAKVVGPQLQKAGIAYQQIGYLEPIAAYEREADKLEPVDPKRAKAGRVLLNKALAAKGGRAKVAGIRTMTLDGSATLTQGGRRVPIQVTRYYEAPNRMRMDMSIAGGALKSTIVVDAKAGWMRQERGGKSQVVSLPPAEVALASSQLWRDQELVLLRHLDKGAVVEELPREKVDGAMLRVVRLARPSGKASVKLYIDPKTFLLRRMVYRDQGAVTQESYSNYKSVSGIKVAHTRKTKSPRGAFEAKLDKIEFNKKLPAKLWAKPKK